MSVAPIYGLLLSAGASRRMERDETLVSLNGCAHVDY